jgi:hypothetical protein
MTAAILHGAAIVRVHAVRPAVEAARIADAILEKQESSHPSEQRSLAPRFATPAGNSGTS